MSVNQSDDFLNQEEDMLLSEITDYAEYNDLDNIASETQETIDAIVDGKNDLDNEYEIQYDFASLDFDKLEKFVITVEDRYPGVFEIPDAEEGTDYDNKTKIYTVTLIVLRRIQFADIMQDIKNLVEIATPLRIAFDGWGCQCD